MKVLVLGSLGTVGRSVSKYFKEKGHQVLYWDIKLGAEYDLRVPGSLNMILQDVDFVTWFDEDTPYNLIQLIKPEILVKGGDWSINKIVGSREVLAYGGSVHSIPFLFDTSTTKLINKIRHV